MSKALNWRQILDDAAAFDDSDEAGVPREEVLKQLTAEGYESGEARQMFRDAPVEMVNDDLDNPRVRYAGDKEETNGEATNGHDDEAGEYDLGDIPEPWKSGERWFCWAYDDGRKIPRAPWYDGDSDHWDAWQSWKEEEMWTDYATAAEWCEKVPEYKPATAIPEVEDNDEVRSVLVDFDDVRDPETGEIHDGVEEFRAEHGLGDAPLYESTSGTGAHAYIRGALPGGKKPSAKTQLDDEPFADHDSAPEVEIYASSRFVAVSGELIDGTPEIPRNDDAVESIYEAHAEDNTPTQNREPELDREGVQDVDETRDIDEIYDAIQHVTLSDITMRSKQTENSGSRKSFNPSWESCSSGTVLGYDDGWIYRDGDIGLDALQVVALEERIISRPTEYPEGEDFFDALDELRARGAHIPELDDKDVAALGEGLSDGAGGDGGDGDGGEGGDDEDGGDSPKELAEAELRGWLRGFEDAKDRRPRKGEKTAKAEGALLEKAKFRYVRDTDKLYRWDRDARIWRDDGEEWITAVLKDGLDSEWSNRVNSDALQRIKSDPRVAVDSDEFEVPRRMVPVEDGIYNLETDELRERRPEDCVTETMNAPAGTDAEAERFRGVAESATRGGDTDKLQEYAGYILMHGEMPHHKALFIAGPKASGKSTFIDILNRMLPSEKTSSSTPQQLTRRFGPACLHGKWFNKSPDIPAEEIDDAGVFKMITGDDSIDAEIKGVQERVSFKPSTKHIFSANQLPNIYEADDAFWRRVLICAFPDTIDKEDRVDKFDEVLFEEERAGILNWMIEGARRLIDEGGFTADRDLDATRDRWQKWGTSVVQWKARRTRDDMDAAVVKSEAYEDYRRYCKDAGFRPVTRQRFGGTLKEFPYIGDTTVKRDNKKRNAYSGITFSDGLDAEGEEYDADLDAQGGDDDGDGVPGDAGRWQG